MRAASKVEISGSKSVEFAIDFLEQHADDEIESITIEITEDVESTQEKDQTADERVEEQEEQSIEMERERGDIRVNTSHHRVLHALSNLEQPAAGKDVENEVEGVNESSIYPALTQLYQRMLADRERIDDAANPYHVYSLTDYGAEKLDELGEPESSEGE